MAEPYIHNFAPAVNYTTVKKTTFQVIVNGEALVITDAKISMVVKSSTDSSKKIEELTTENGKIVIVDSNNFDIEERFLRYPNRDEEHGYDIRICLPGDEYKTYIKGLISIIATNQDPV